MDFKAFPKIERIGKMSMQITQKIHGTNAQVFIYKDSEGNLQLLTGSRTRWITPESDNYGFAAHVYANKQEFIDKLGPGQHFGEWAGPGINSGEGLTEKTFVLFDWWKYPVERELPPKTVAVPVLYQGEMSLAKLEEVMTDLKTTGSKLMPGFMRPEGVVVSINGSRYKKVFDAEETKWKKADEVYRAAKEYKGPDLSYLLQPVRLEKLLSRDETYIKDFPKTMSLIVDEYFKDLVAENQVQELDVKETKRNLNASLFKFVRETIEKNS